MEGSDFVTFEPFGLIFRFPQNLHRLRRILQSAPSLIPAARKGKLINQPEQLVRRHGLPFQNQGCRAVMLQQAEKNIFRRHHILVHLSGCLLCCIQHLRSLSGITLLHKNICMIPCKDHLLLS